MKIIDIRNTSQGWVADCLLSERSILPTSIPVLECSVDDLVRFAESDPAHMATHFIPHPLDDFEEWADEWEKEMFENDPRTSEQYEQDALYQEWKQTYQSLI